MTTIRGLDAWMRVLMHKDLPSLNSVVKDICKLSEHDDCRTDELTTLILRDADLTSKVLKISNSIHYNRTFSPIRTVSRAVAQLGFENLKNITLATSLIDGFLKGKPKELLIQRLAKSFHAAVQAKAMVPYLDGDHKEQVFIAALLRNIGELALLSSGQEVGEQFVVARDLNPEKEQAIALEYLGVDIDDINRALIKEWSLSTLVREASHDNHQPSAMVRAVNIGNELSKYIHKGANSPEMARIYVQISQLCDLNLEAAKTQVAHMAEEAAIVAKGYGAEKLLSSLPNLANIASAKTDATVQVGHEFQQLLNHVLRFVLEGGDLSKVMQFSTAALHEGSGIKRVAIAMLDYKSKCIDVRYIAGKDTYVWRQKVRIELDNLHKGELLHDFLRAQVPMWYQPSHGTKPLGALAPLGHNGDIMMAALKKDNRLIGILYADNAGELLSSRQFEDFQLVANQLNLILKINAN